MELNDTQITDITILSGLTDLETLWVCNNNLSEIHTLASLTNLKFLHL
ncbi:leucine-rich repeat domain-containing protein, partial [Candidatus Neomarinimicrobiota bacterium]